MLNSRPYLPCSDVIAFLGDYLARELTPEITSEFERHLAVCPACVAYLRSYEETIRIARGALQIANDPAGYEDAPEELVAAILAATTGA